MGNTLFTEILYNITSNAVSKNCLQEPSLFTLKKTKDIFVNNTIDTIDLNFNDVIFVENSENNSSDYFKNSLKKSLAIEIFKIQRTTEFKNFLREMKIENSVVFLNLFCSVIEDSFFPSMLKMNVASQYTDGSSVFIKFNKNQVFKIHTLNSKKNIQSFYIYSVFKVFLDTFIKDQRTSRVASFIKQSFINESKIIYEIIFFMFLLLVILIGVGILIYIYYFHNIKKDDKSSLFEPNIL